ncbi:MAG: hypothetical protein HXS47_11905 [Theionarchaea archaeon]|nr:hypothetical protein [Theionarchaea archaeon]
MVSKNMKIVAVCAMVAVIIGTYCAYASNHAFDVKGESSSVSFEMNVGEQVLNTTLETYVGGDPTRMIEFTLINPNVERIYILFRASEVETDNPSLVKASASVGEGLGAAIGKRRLNITPENILPREISWFHRVLIYSGFMGTESEPVIYFKTPNVGGTEDRIIVMNGIIIIESSTFENSYLLGSFIRQLVMK